MIIASLLETVAWVTGKKTVLTKFRVAYTCATRWHNIEKARRVLGYEPQVGVEEGMRRTMEVRPLLPAFFSEYSFGFVFAVVENRCYQKVDSVSRNLFMDHN